MKFFDLNQYEGIIDGYYTEEKRRLQIEFLKLQEWVIEKKKRIAIVFEGRDAAGKTGTINTIKCNLIPEYVNYFHLGKPNINESRNWLRSFEKKMPKAGEITFFDRSWYSRATVEIVMGYASPKQYNNFMNKVNSWEDNLKSEGLELQKIYLSISKVEQKKRFIYRKEDPLKYWKLTDHDLNMLKKWDTYSDFKQRMFDRTSTKNHPWSVIRSNNRKIARLSSLRLILNQFDYPKKKLEFENRFNSRITNYSLKFKGITFKDLSHEQHKVLRKHLTGVY